VTVLLTTPTLVANMDGAEHDFWPVITEFVADAGPRLGAQRGWVRSSAPIAVAVAPGLE
jgi:hypothetical protein